MEQFELPDAEWEEVLEVLRTEAEKREINTGDFPEMLLLMKRIWKLLTIRGQRQNKILHGKHIRLAKNKADQTVNLQTTTDELDGLAVDPGDPIPDVPKPVIVAGPVIRGTELDPNRKSQPQ